MNVNGVKRDWAALQHQLYLCSYQLPRSWQGLTEQFTSKHEELSMKQTPQEKPVLCCRQAVKLLRLDPSPSPSQTLPVHSSLAAAGAWRYSQLLTALPRRDTEASAWKQFAAARSPIELESVLGPLDILKGGKDSSSGIVVDLLMLRALPCW